MTFVRQSYIIFSGLPTYCSPLNDANCSLGKQADMIICIWHVTWKRVLKKEKKKTTEKKVRFIYLRSCPLPPRPAPRPPHHPLKPVPGIPSWITSTCLLLTLRPPVTLSPPPTGTNSLYMPSTRLAQRELLTCRIGSLCQDDSSVLAR